MFAPVKGSIFLILLVTLAFVISIAYIPTTHVVSEETSAVHDVIQEEKDVLPSEQIEAEDASSTPSLTTFVRADLTAMTISLVTSTSTVTMPIVSKGKPGSYYETPGGMYENDYKETSHFSSIGHVFMPWSVHVVGNFFIHGIPYYADGTKVDSTYSGGCIRLADADAKRVYDFVTPHTIILIDQGNNEFFPSTDSRSHTPLTSAEMTRYMSAIISLEFQTQDSPVTFNEMETTRRKLLYDLLVHRNANVARSYASSYGKNLFVQRMNEKAVSLGLTHTTFSAADEDAQTSLEDFETFMNYVHTYKSYIFTLAIPTA